MCLVASLALTGGGLGVSPGSIGVIVGLLVSTLAGHVAGNLLGLAGLRLLPVSMLFVLLFVGATLSGIALGPIALFLFVATFSALGGYLGIASRLDVVAAWYPLSFCVGGALVWMNRHGAIATFRSGSKHALWDPFTIVCLAGGVFLMLVFLATRSALGLTVWQEVARPKGTGGEVAVARPGRGSLAVLFVFSLAVLGATALLSPYLFRTADAKDGASGGEHGGDEKESNAGSGEGKSGGGASGKGGDGEGASGAGGPGKGGAGKDGAGKDGDGDGQATSGSGKPGDGEAQGSRDNGGHGKEKSRKGKDGKGSSGDRGGASGEDDPLGGADSDHAGEAAKEALAIGMRLFVWLLVLAAALLVLLGVLFPPLRRAMLLRHLERPLWPVAPTARVMNAWRRALAWLAVVGIEPASAETASDFARRAEIEVRQALGCEPHGLRDAAAIVEKIAYAGRGLAPGDEHTIRAAVGAFVDQVRPRIGLRKKLVAAWSRAPEVES